MRAKVSIRWLLHLVLRFFALQRLSLLLALSPFLDSMPCEISPDTSGKFLDSMYDAFRSIEAYSIYFSIHPSKVLIVLPRVHFLLDSWRVEQILVVESYFSILWTFVLVHPSLSKRAFRENGRARVICRGLFNT